ncbi:MAG: flagellar protein FliS [Blastomonas sp.]
MSFINSPKSFSYQNVDSASRVAGAGAHELISILFDELLLRLDQTIKHAQRNEVAMMLQSRSRASSILNALEESLDFKKGGELALALAKIYREAGRRINAATRPDDIDRLSSARQMLAEIAEAWRAIAPK